MKQILSYIYLYFVVFSNAQDINNTWQLGNNTIKFNTNPPTVSSAGVVNQYGNASISDQNGNLLFYTDGIKVWNKNHQLIYNIGFHNSAYQHMHQKVIIVPQPNSNRYYIFVTIPDQMLNSSNNTLHRYLYCVVDFSNNPLGEIVVYRSFLNYYGDLLGQGFNGPLTVVKNNANDGYWIIVQAVNDIGTTNNNLLSYKLISTGLVLQPVISPFSNTLTSPINQRLSFKFSPDNTKMGVLESSYSDRSNFFTYDFNSSTGQFTNKQNYSIYLIDSRFCHSFEFSSDSQKVYFASNKIFVKDLLNPSISVRDIATLPSLPTNDPAVQFTPNGHLQRDKNGDIILISSSFSSVKKIENQNSFSLSTVSGSLFNLNHTFNSNFSLPQLIPEFTTLCSSNLSINSNVLTGQENKQASQTINATNQIFNGATAVYHAGNEVVLKNGFVARNGSWFRAYIEGCTGVFVKNNNHNNESNDFVFKSEDVFEIAETIKVYPNPNNGRFEIQLPQETSGSLELYDMTGKVIYTKAFTDLQNMSVDIKNYPKGIYLLRVNTATDSFTQKVIRN
jgi:hypothetical protein